MLIEAFKFMTVSRNALSQVSVSHSECPLSGMSAVMSARREAADIR
jgi:hypothetical protein